MCKTEYKVFDIMKGLNFMNLYIYQIFSPCHVGRANLQCDIKLESNLISKDVRSQGLSKIGVHYCEIKSEILFVMDKMFILREFNLLQRVTRWLLS